jgi:hypothetical protein
MTEAEHILLESDERVVPTLETARRIHARVELRGGPWRHVTVLALIDGCYLAVRTVHAKSVTARYVVDLRFADPAPRLERRIAWRSLAAGATCLALAIFFATREIAVTVALSGGAACALFAAFHLTTETLTLFSANGRARLVAHTGRVGTFRALRQFRARLESHLLLALGARRGSRALHLRDEMREHFRLRSAGALTETEYEDAKRRILATHVPAAAPVPATKVREALSGTARPIVRA